MSDIIEIKRELASRAQDVAEYLLPRGVRQGREWCVGSVQGEPGQSLRVCVSGAKAGLWSDFAEGGEGGDLIDLWQAVKGVTLVEALEQIRGFLGIKRPSFEPQRKPQWRRPSKPQCTRPKGEVRAYLTIERQISDDAIRAYRVGERGKDIVFPGFVGDDLIFVKYIPIDRHTAGRKPKPEAQCEPILLGWQVIDPDAREVVITEGEIDAMTMWDYGFPALSVPFGGGKGNKQQWIESEFDRLARFERIYLALDMDHEGDLAVEEISKRLGRHRCYRVNLPHKDANECRKRGLTREDMRRLIDEATTRDPEELRRAGDYTEAVLRLFYPVGGVEPGYTLPWAKVRDKVRFKPAEMTVWTGSTGHGKSQVLSHAMVECGRQGGKVCVASLEMRPPEWIKRMVKQAGNIDRPTEAFHRAIMAWLNEWLFVFDHVGKRSVEHILEVFDYARARYGCDVFVIDSLMRLGISPDDYEAQEQAVYTMVNWAVDREVHLHLVAHSRKRDTKTTGGAPESEDVKGTSEIVNNAFNIIGVWRNRRIEDQVKELAEMVEQGDEVAKEALRDIEHIPPVTINVAKQRTGDWEGKCGLWFDQRTYQYRCKQDPPHGFKYLTLRDEVAA